MKNFSVKPDFLKMPFVHKGMRIGLFGGSFNPPHEGHVLVAKMAIRRLKLDQVWWMVTPGNPLKNHDELAELSVRIELSRKICKDRRIKITGFEAAHDLHYTAQTLDFIRKRNRGVNFVWLMGADNLTDFHRWQNWRYIMNIFPVAIVDRPGSTLSYLSSGLSSQMTKTFAHARIDERDAGQLICRNAPAWTFLHRIRSSISSTELRKAEKQAKSPPPVQIPT